MLIDKVGGNINLLNYFFFVIFVYGVYDKFIWVYIIFFLCWIVMVDVCVDW